MDIEQICRFLYAQRRTEVEIISELKLLLRRFSNTRLSSRALQAIVREIKFSSQPCKNSRLQRIFHYPVTGLTAGEVGVGCRGEGDFFVHRKIVEIARRKGAKVGARDLDDAGVMKINARKYQWLTVAVDGTHSRLSHFPFLAGFHAARAALRDVIVMGAQPVALLSDIHLGNDGDVGKLFDYTAGICCVGEGVDVPLVTGSTLRIGGDLVLGDRLVGCVGAVGLGRRITARKSAVAGDYIVMTEGSGGGTVATTALFNSFPSVVEETLNLTTVIIGMKLLSSQYLAQVHAMTDITNGGIRGDVFEISRLAGVKIVLDEEKLRFLLNPKVLAMLDELKIDYKGISTDQILLTAPKAIAENIVYFVRSLNTKAEIVGHIMTGSGVFLKNDGKLTELRPMFREEPYTPIKKVVGTARPKDWNGMKRQLQAAAREALMKKERLLRKIRAARHYCTSSSK